MKILIEIRYDKLKYKEYISIKKEEKHFSFGYPLLDFVNSNIKESYTNIINNSDDISKDLENLLNKDDNIIFNLFYGDDLKRQLQNSTLDDKQKDKRIKKLFDIVQEKQLIFSTIIDFCFLYNSDKTSYTRGIDRFIFICNKLNYPIIQPKYTYSAHDLDGIGNINIKDVDFETLDKEYINFKLNNRKLNIYDAISSYTCESIDELFSIFMITIFERNYIISKCQNCNKFFVPFRKNDAIYCDRISPQKDNKTCKEYASKRPKGVLELYRKIYMKKFARVSRNKDNYTLKNDFETWKSQVEKLKADYNAGTLSADEFEKWLLDNDK